jgi:hypothetical protein
MRKIPQPGIHFGSFLNGCRVATGYPNLLNFVGVCARESPNLQTRPSFVDVFYSPLTFPDSTVTDALGSNTFCPNFHSTVLRFGGPSGSA